MSQSKNNEECCPKFDPKPWDEVTHEWQDKLFIRDHLPQFFHIPLPGCYGRAIKRLSKQAQDAGAVPDINEYLMLAHDPSAWRSDLYMMVTREVPGADNIRLSGTYFSKVFDGPFSKVPQYIRDMDLLLLKRDKLALRYYFYYTTCPKCAVKYGHNYMVAFAEI